jgi:hypothetical protein
MAGPVWVLGSCYEQNWSGCRGIVSQFTSPADPSIGLQRRPQTCKASGTGTATGCAFEEDDKLLERTFEHPEFMKLRTLFIAAQSIRHAERMLHSDIPAVPTRTDTGNGEKLHCEVDDSTIKIWKGWAYSIVMECRSEGREDVADAFRRRAMVTDW